MKRPADRALADYYAQIRDDVRLFPSVSEVNITSAIINVTINERAESAAYDRSMITRLYSDIAINGVGALTPVQRRWRRYQLIFFFLTAACLVVALSDAKTIGQSRKEGATGWQRQCGRYGCASEYERGMNVELDALIDHMVVYLLGTGAFAVAFLITWFAGCRGRR